MKKQLLLFSLILLFLLLFSAPIFTQCISRPNGIAIDPANNFIYWSEIGGRQIVRGALDGTGIPTVLFDATDGVRQPRDLAIDVPNGFIYWTKLGPFPNQILQGQIDGTGPPLVLFDTPNDGVNTPNGIDFLTGLPLVLWSEVTTPAILLGDPTAPFGGSVPLFFGPAPGLEGPRGIEVNNANTIVYWADFDPVTLEGKIVEGNIFMPIAPTVLFDLGPDTSPHSIALDEANGLIYWTDVLNNRIQVGNINGTGTPNTLFDANDGINGPRHISFDAINNRLYWTELDQNQIVCANANGSGQPIPLFIKAWDGGGDGLHWDDASNWTGDVVPMASDRVLISPNSRVIIRNAGAVAMNVNIDINSKLVLNQGASLTINGSCNNGLKIEQFGSIDLFGTLSINDTEDDAVDLTFNTRFIIGGTGILNITDSEEDGIDMQGGFLKNAGTINIADTENAGMALFGDDCQVINTGQITIQKAEDSEAGNGIFMISSLFDNFGKVNISETGNDGLGMLDLGGSATRFINHPNAILTLNNIGDDGLDFGNGTNILINNGDINLNDIDDTAINMDVDATFTNNCKIIISGADIGLEADLGNFTNNRQINIGLDAGSTQDALFIGSNFTNAACGFINITSNHQIFIDGGASLTNQGLITSVFTGANNNNGTFNNNGEIRPATYNNTGNSIIGNNPVDGVTPATEALDPVACAECLVPLVPTLSEWGLIILALILLNIGFLLSQIEGQLFLSYTKTELVNLFKTNFSLVIYLRMLSYTLLFIFIIFGSNILYFEYQITSADPFGIIISALLIAYLLHNILLENRKVLAAKRTDRLDYKEQ